MTHAACIQVTLIPPVGLTFLLIDTASRTGVFQRAEGAGIQRSVAGVHACCMLCSFCRVSGIGLGLQNIHALIPPLEKVITNQKILLLALAGYTCHPSMPSIQPMTHAACIQVALIPPVGLAFLLIVTASRTGVF